jgi:hypothetical protein
MKYTTNNEKTNYIKNDFNKLKDVKKRALDELRKGFEEDRRRFAKVLYKNKYDDKKR